jgi:hypothetical protein
VIDVLGWHLPGNFPISLRMDACMAGCHGRAEVDAHGGTLGLEMDSKKVSSSIACSG